MQADLQDVLRYLGAGDSTDPQLYQQVSQTAHALSTRLQPRFVWRMFPLQEQGGSFVLEGSGLTLTGTTARTMLQDCHSAVLLCCTLGAEFDAMLRREQVRDMARAVILDACGSALVEGGCDAAQQEIARHFPHLFLTDRFSPGYGDLPLSLQPAICAALDTPRRLGVQATPSLLLNPGKSVTAVIGLSHRPQMARVRGCAFCSMKETCALRKGGTHCGI